MDFNAIVKEFAKIKVYDYISSELADSAMIMSEKLLENCQDALAFNFFLDAQRILSYEYNMFQDSGIIAEDLSPELKMKVFSEIVLSDRYSGEFDERYRVFTETKKNELANLSRYQKEIVRSFIKDSEMLKTVFSSDFDEVVEINCGRGDLHNGKSVAFVRFANGRKLLYKPRNEYNAILLEKVVRFLAKGTELSEYRFIEFYSTENHAWERIVEHHYCNSTDEIERYYYRAGVILSAFYFLSSFDMHHENVICDGEFPIIIDCETLTLCTLQNGREQEADSKDPLDSVLGTAFIPFVDEQSVFGVSLSGILSEKGAAKPTWQALVVRDGTVGFKQEHIEIQEEKNTVSLTDGTSIDNELAKSFVLSGFSDACRYAISNKNMFCNLVESFFEQYSLEFRQLLRATQVYYQFIQASKHPEMLQDDSKRDEIFMILSNNFVPGKFGYLRVQHEIAEMKKWEIPLYYVKATETDLMSGGAVICKNYYAEAPLKKILRKITKFDNELFAYQIELIKMSFAMLAKASSFGRTTVMQAPVDAPMSDEYLSRNVTNFACKLKKMLFMTGKNVSSMLTLGFSKGSRFLSFKALDYNLYESGLTPLFLAYYGKHFDDSDAINCARRIIEQYYLMFRGACATRMRTGSPQDLSAFSGIGGLLYLSYNMYLLTQEKQYLEKYLEQAEFLLDCFMKIEKLSSGDYEYLTGTVSSVSLICRIYLENPKESDSIRYLLQSAIEKSVAELDIASFNTVGFAHGISGVLVSLLSFYQFSSASDILHLMRQLLDKEDELIASGQWEEEAFSTWCRGKSGVLLSRDILKKAMIPLEKTAGQLSRYDHWLYSEDYFKQDNLCLCHGVFGNIEIAKSICNNDTEVKAYLPNKIFEKFSDLEWIAGTQYEFEGGMTGNTGIAYVMLELLNAAPPILTLGLYK